ncbi:MAG: EF-hand domain-containing protein [Candidatus Thalassarchaeaceae archaeon]|tara:strand:+ start:75 stop:647 length:573 start_codon:yes stop_codon:yes gene_type:complete
MAEINLHPDDEVLSTLEMAKEMGKVILILSIFEVMFFGAYLSEGTLLPLVCGIPLGLILFAMIWQSLMHLLGFGKMVRNGNEIVLRTPNSAKRRTSILDPLGRMIAIPIARAAMRSADRDGDGLLSFDELLEEFEVESKSEYEDLWEQFDKYDEDGDGFISLSELENFILHSDDNWAEEDTSTWWSSGED